VTGVGRLDQCTGILDLLVAGYLRLGEVVIEKITTLEVWIGRGGNGGGEDRCSEVDEYGVGCKYRAHPDPV